MRNVTLRQMRVFVAVARHLSFTRAARELHLTQSGVSHSMKALEGDVGCRLLDRLGKKVILTQAGEQLLHHATKILQEMENARESLAHLGKWGRGRLRLGASTTVCQYLIPPVLREFKVATILLTQNLAVLDERIGETAREGLCGLMGSKIFGPQGHAATRQWASEQIGKCKTLVRTTTKGGSSNHHGSGSNYSTSVHEQWDYRVPPEENAAGPRR